MAQGTRGVRGRAVGPGGVGGAEDKDGGEILERFVALAGGDAARIAVIPTASADAEEAGERYVGIFRGLGAAAADWLRVGQRSDANAGPALGLLAAATGIFITGGDQARLVALMGGTAALGIGLDEDTAVLIGREGTLEVLGTGMVTIVDGRNATSDHFEREVGEVLSVIDSHLFVLGPGRRFDLDARRALPAA
jgi:cyanophycinase